MTRVLALDLASVCGWAVGSTTGGDVSHGVLKLPKTGDDIGRYLRTYRDWLGHAIEQLAPGQIVFEAPILPAMCSIASRRKLFGLCGVTELVALDCGVPVVEAYMQQVRKHFIGTSKAPSTLKTPEVKRMWLKRRTIAECQARGFAVADDNDADALALLDLRLSQLCAGYSLRATPLFKGAA